MSWHPIVKGKCANLGAVQTRRDLREKLGTCNFCNNRETEYTTEVTGGSLAFRACDDCLIKLAESAFPLMKARKIAKAKVKNRAEMVKYLENGGTLYSADPDCEHEMDQRNFSGVKCSKCSGWFCY